MNSKYNSVVLAAILHYEQTTGNTLRRKPIDYDPVTTLWSHNFKSYPDFQSLITANSDLFLRPEKPKKPTRTRDPELILFEQRYSMRIYGHHVKRAKIGWSCTNEDHTDFVHAPTLYALMQLAPYAYKDTSPPPKPPKQLRTKLPTLKELVASLKAPSPQVQSTKSPSTKHEVPKPKASKPKQNRKSKELTQYPVPIKPGYNVRKHKDQWACMNEAKTTSLFFPDLQTLFDNCPYVLDQ